MPGIFEGITILDLTKVFSGPFATRLLVDYGAEVIKIEHFEHGDDSRLFPPLKNGASGYFEMLNRGKKSVALNLKEESDRGLFFRLSTEADVIVENFTPQIKTKLNIDYNAIRAHNPKIIYASLAGVDQLSNKKYYDVLAQAESGLMSLTGKDTPTKIGPAVVDAFSGSMLAFAISGALLHRERTGEGQEVQVSMLASAMQLLESNLTASSISGANPQPAGNQDNLIAPFGMYACANGHVALGVGNEVQWEALVVFLETHEPVARDMFSDNTKRLEHQSELTALIERVFAHYTVTDLLAQLKKHKLAHAPVNTMMDVLNDSWFEESEATETISHSALGECRLPGYPISFSKAPRSPYSPAPGLGDENESYEV